jgi:hypothetical protein
MTIVALVVIGLVWVGSKDVFAPAWNAAAAASIMILAHVCQGFWKAIFEQTFIAILPFCSANIGIPS